MTKRAKGKAAVPQCGQSLDEESIGYGPLVGYLGYQVRQAQAAIFRDFPRRTEGLNITPGEFGLLVLVDCNPGISQVKLAGAYGLDKSTLSLALTDLVKRGLIERTRSKKDQRYFALWLKDAGRNLLKQATQRVERQEKAMSSVLRPGEKELLLDMLQRIAKPLER